MIYGYSIFSWFAFAHQIQIKKPILKNCITIEFKDSKQYTFRRTFYFCQSEYSETYNEQCPSIHNIIISWKYENSDGTMDHYDLKFQCF